MIKLNSHKAISLVELIIACLLVAVMVLGMFAVNQVLSNYNQDYGQIYLVKSATQTTLDHILNNANLAIGGGPTVTAGGSGGQTVFDQGILLGGDQYIPFADNNSFCIHQNIQPPPYSTGTTIDNAPVNSTNPSTAPNYTNSRWLCYTWYPVGTNYGSGYNNTIYYCAMAYNYLDSHLGAASCVPNNGTGTAPTYYLGTAISMSPSFKFGVLESSELTSLGLTSTQQSSLTTYLVSNGYLANSAVANAWIVTPLINSVSVAGGHVNDLNWLPTSVPGNPVTIYYALIKDLKLNFSITINNCLNNAGPNCIANGGGGSSANPEVQLTGSTIPSQEGTPQS